MHFEVLSRPNVFIKGSSGRGASQPNPDKVEFMASVLGRMKEPLNQVGLKNARMHAHRANIQVRLPVSAGLRPVNGYLSFRATAKDATVLLGIDGLETGEKNLAALQVVRQKYESLVESALPSPVDQWTRGIGGAVRAYATSTLAGHGYKEGNAEASAAWAEKMLLAWLQLLTGDPIPDIETAAAERAAATEQVVLTDEPSI